MNVPSPKTRETRNTKNIHSCIHRSLPRARFDTERCPPRSFARPDRARSRSRPRASRVRDDDDVIALDVIIAFAR